MRYLVRVYSLVIAALSAWPALSFAGESWPGVDEAVVEKFAEQGGRPATGCLMNLEGDALLFAFLLAGVLGGFIMGYYYRDFAGGRGEGRAAGREPGKADDAG